MSPQQAYNQLALYTLSIQDGFFIHQYIVDAFTAQNATTETKPITIYFALVGLYLNIEKGFTGRQVQLAHIKMAKEKKDWPTFKLPNERGGITVFDVLKAPAGVDRNESIKAWSRNVWDAYTSEHERIAELANSENLL